MRLQEQTGKKEEKRKAGLHEKEAAQKQARI